MTILAAPPRYSTRTIIRIIVIVVAILIGVKWAVVGVSLVTSRQHAIDNARSQGRNLTIAFREEIALILRGVDGEMDLIAQRMKREGDKFDLYAWGQESVLVTPGLAQAIILGPDGIVRSTTIEPHPRPTDLSDRRHFRIHLDGRFHGLYIGQPILGRISVGVPFIPISRRVDAEDGTFLGVLVVLISPGGLTTLPKSIDLGPHGVMTLSGLDNVIRARFSADSPDGTKGIGKSIVGGPLEGVTEDAPGWLVRSSVIDGVPRLFTYSRVVSYPLIVTVGLGLDEELAAWRSYAAMNVASAVVASLLLSGFAAYLIRRILRDAGTDRLARLAITHTAEHDFLTGLPNRLLLEDRIGQALAAAQRHNDKVAVLFMDLDGFKQINDSLGHQIGDRLLQSVAGRLVACVRASDTVSRQGGDEFVALLSEIREPEDAAIVSGKMLQAVARAHSIGQHELRVTTSIGVSIYPDDGLDAETLVEHADTAMYEAKENGRHCCRFFTPAMNVQAVTRQSIEEDVPLAS